MSMSLPQGQKICTMEAIVYRANGTVENLGLVDHSHAYLHLNDFKSLAKRIKVKDNLERLWDLAKQGLCGATVIPTGSASISGGKAVYAGLAEGSGQVVPLYIAFGQGSPAGTRITALVTDLGLAGEVAAPGGVNTNTGQSARITGTASLVTTTNNNDTFQVVGTITAGAALALTEAGLFDTSPFPAQSTVATQGALSGTGTGTFTITDATGWPTAATNYQIESEVLTATRSGTTVTITVRGVNGSSAASHASASVVTDVTAGGTGGGGLCAAKGDFAVINLATNDTLQLTGKVQFT